VTNGKYVIAITFRYQYDNYAAQFINLAVISRLFFPHFPFRLYIATASSVHTPQRIACFMRNPAKIRDVARIIQALYAPSSAACGKWHTYC
jgi:hypothetical protein